MSAIGNVAREARAQQRKRRFILIALGGLAFIGMLAARPLMRLWGSLESKHELAVAKAAIAHEDWMPALQAVQHAAHSAPHDPEMLRTGVLVLVGLNAHPDEVLRTIAQVEAAGGMTSEMLLKRAQAQLQRGDMRAAEQALYAMPEAQRQCWEAVELEATLLLRQGRADEAGERLQATEIVDSPDTLFRRAVLELGLMHGPRRVLARRVIWQTARGDGSNKLLALTLLSQDVDLTASEADELLHLADQGSSSAADGLRYSVLGQVFRLAPERKESLLKAESARAASLPTEQQVGFLLFLAKQQAPQAMLDFLRDHGKSLAKERPTDHVNLELEALAKSKDWAAVRSKLKTQAARSMNSLSLNLWQACATDALEPSSPATLEHLQRAYETTEHGRDLAGASRVADTAMNLGQAVFAATCYEELATKPMLPADQIAMLEKASMAVAQTRDTTALRRVAHALAEQTPGHLGNAYRADYLDILCGESLEGMVPRLNAQDSTIATDPIAQAHQRLLWAMIYSRREQKEMLNRELDGLEKRIFWTAGERAVLAGLLAKVGETARAWQLAEKLPESLLLSEEAAMLATAK